MHLLSSYQVVNFMIFREEWLSLSVLVLNKCLDIQVETLCRRAFGGLCGKLTFLKQKSQQWKQGVPE